jgi:hypothetical protein
LVFAGSQGCERRATSSSWHGSTRRRSASRPWHDDTLIGGFGDDTLTGGNGRDTFVLAGSVGHDVITDFKVADRSQFDPALFANAAGVLTNSAKVGLDTFIKYDAANTVTLVGVARTSLKGAMQGCWAAGAAYQKQPSCSTRTRRWRSQSNSRAACCTPLRRCSSLM